MTRSPLALVALTGAICLALLPLWAPAYYASLMIPFFGYAIALFGMLGAAFVSLILWPFYSVLGWLRGSKALAATEQSTLTTSTPDAAPTASPLASVDIEQTTPCSPSVP